jgi:hypothetical protein
LESIDLVDAAAEVSVAVVATAEMCMQQVKTGENERDCTDSALTKTISEISRGIR